MRIAVCCERLRYGRSQYVRHGPSDGFPSRHGTWFGPLWCLAVWFKGLHCHRYVLLESLIER